MEVKVEQGSVDWLIERASIPTASNFKRIITSSGKKSAQFYDYAYELAADSIMDDLEETFQSYAMTRGIEMEPVAKSVYEIVTNCKIEDCGFFKKRIDENCLIGCSPDGIVGDNGLVEIKCPLKINHMKYLLGGVVPSDYYAQVQGQLLVMDREWCDFVSYNPNFKEPFKIMIVRVTRDVEYTEELSKLCVKLCKKRDSIIDLILKNTQN
jgi:exodeoxyribonuclease (lambda-induced)